jgi:hypothetical protein
MNILRFEANTPVQVALKYDGGRDVAGRYGPQVLYTLADGRLMYLDPKAAHRIDELKITAGEPFSICKREGKNGQKRTVEWEVKRLEPAPTTARLKIVPPGGSGEAGAAESAPLVTEFEPGHVARSSRRSGAAASDRQKSEPAMNGSESSTLETQLRASIPGVTKLEYALKTAIAAAAGAEQFGHEIGYAVRFAPDDIRAMAITVFAETRKQS